ncbi:DUF192 domain-containing protein [Arenibacterium halophilum]|uniref:DUF192 domain-containing protein n=1 Tax=Arenibacterium halophilum TaxID=2583821 RepID=A0ABY2XBR5_9RHOB|nr:DUF192 domain-containing protein [Arenibacterium halophilum]TMV14453.1 DUF192 domain-containing protein [Arenibacterium halophilum]
MKLTGFFVAAALALCGGGLHAETCRDDRVQLRGDWGSAGFSVEVVDTVEDRARGLMFREEMPRGAGMLFVYDTPGPVSFWMKNTLIPLDMVFVDDAGTVQRVHSNAIPGDLTPIDGGDDILVVLEINGGLAQRYGIGPGSQLRHPVFSDNGPVWPC